MKILHLYTNLNLTCGITRTIHLICKNLKEDYDQIVFGLAGDAIVKFYNSDIDTIVSKNKSRGVLSPITHFFEILSIIKKQKIDVIHNHHRYFDFITFIISKLISIKTITSVQSKVYGKKSLSYKAENIIACSNSIKEHLIKYFKIDPNKIRVIYNFVDPKEIKISTDKSILKRELHINQNTIVIGFIGRFSIREKGVDILLEAFKRIICEYTYLKLIMIGDGDDKEYMKNFISINDLNAILVSPKENIYEYYNIIDIVVLPSRIEPFGIVAVEAGFMRKSFIASDIDGLKEIVDNGLNGILFQCESVDALTSSLRTLVHDNTLRTNLGDKLYLKVKNNFTSEKIIPLYKNFYQNLRK